MHKVHLCWLLGVMVTLLMACDEQDPVPTPCDPMATDEVPISLRYVIMAGQDADGTIYLLEGESADELSAPLLFVSQEDELHRVYIRGAGIGSIKGVGKFFSLGIGEGESAQTIVAELSVGGDAAMATCPGHIDTMMEDLDPSCTVLTIIDQSSIEGMPVHNLPGLKEMEYAATTDDGSWIIVVRPTYDWDYLDMRLFIGAEDALLEYPIDEVVRYTDGGSTHIYFTKGDEAADLFFGIDLSQSGSAWGEAYLQLGDTTRTVTRHAVESSPGDASFMCLPD